jgi:hypothetical protein
MSRMHPRVRLAARSGRSPGSSASSSSDAVLRAVGVVSLLAIGAIHFLQIVPTTESTPLLGVSFLLLIAAALAVAARLAARGDRRTWVASALVCAAAIGGYVFTRTFSTPLDNQDAGNWSCMLGLAALFVETTLLAFSAYAARSLRALQQARLTVPAQRTAPQILPGDSTAALKPDTGTAWPIRTPTICWAPPIGWHPAGGSNTGALVGAVRREWPKAPPCAPF